MSDLTDSGIVLRPARPEDSSTVSGIRAEAIASSAGLWIDETPTAEGSEAWARGHRERGSMIVAEDATGEILGYATFGPLRDYTGYRMTGEVSIYLTQAAQGRGLGRRMLEELVVRARDAGMHSLSGFIEAGNEASIRLHQRCGFTEAGRMPEAGYKFDRWWDLVIMYRLL